MNTLRGLKRGLAAVSRLWDEGEYDRAMGEVESLMRLWPGNAHLHILWSGLVQLQDDPKHDLSEARRALRLAAELDPDSPAASVELGHFLDAVDDDPRAAVKAYAEGAAAARHLLIEALIGQAKAYRQLDKREEFLACLLEVLQLARSEAPAKQPKAGLNGYAEQVQELLGGLAASH